MFMANYDGPSYLDQAIAEAEAAVRMDPSLSYGYFALGTAYGRKGLGRSHDRRSTERWSSIRTTRAR